MASQGELAQNLPDTLPADFGEWDGEASPAAVPVESPKAEPGGSKPKDTGSRGATARAVPRELAPRDAASRNSQGERSTAPIPRGPVALPNPRAYATPSANAPRTAAQTAAAYPDDDVFLRRIRSLNTVVDKLPATAPPREAMASTAVATPAATAAAVIKAPSIEEALFSGAEDARPLAFRTGLSESQNEEERRAKRKWMMIVGVSVSVVGLVIFQLVHSGTLSMVRHMVAPQTATASTVVQPVTRTAEETPTADSLASKPSASVPAEHAVADTPEQDQARTAPAVQSKMMHDQLLAPTRIPQGVKTAAENDAPPAAGFGGASMAALSGNGPVTNVFSGSAQSKAPAVTLKPVTVSAGVAVGMLIHKTQPLYPPIAKAARVTGTVVIQATISKSGSVENLHVVSGPAMLRQAALDAVKTWRYRPYQLNNEPTQVDTTVDVIFALGG